MKEREEALKHDRGYIGKRYVTIRVVSEQTMNDTLAKGESKVSEDNSILSLIFELLSVEIMFFLLKSLWC